MNPITLLSKIRPLLFLWISAFSLNIIAFFTVAFKNDLHGTSTALKYTMRAGVLWHGDGKNLFVLPLFGLVLNVINLIIAKKIPKDQTFLLHLTAFTSMLVQVLLLGSLLFLASVNI